MLHKGLRLLITVTEKFYDTRHNGDNNYGKNHKGKIPLYYGEISEEITRKKADSNPGNAPDDIVDNKTTVFHAPYTCHKGREGSNYGNKPGNNDRLAAIFFIEMVGLLQVLFIQKTGVFSMKYLRSH